MNFSDLFARRKEPFTPRQDRVCVSPPELVSPQHGRWDPLIGPASVLAVAATIVWIVVHYVSEVNPVDFLVYRYGAAASAQGVDLYLGNLTGPMMSEGGLPFTYTPFAALALLPTTVFDYWTNYVAWSLTCVLAVAWVLNKFIPVPLRHRALVRAAIIFAASATCIVTAHISFGQINLILMFLVLADLFRDDESAFARFVPRGVLVGVAAAIKLTPALFIVFFLVTRQWKLALWSAAGAASATLLGALVYPQMTVEFFGNVLWNLSSRVDLGGFATSGNNSIQGALAAAGSATAPFAAALVVLAATATLAMARTTFLGNREIDAWIIVGLAAPLLSPVSWIHHWVYLLPALTVLLFRHTSIRSRALLAVGYLTVVIGPDFGDVIFWSDIRLLAPIGLYFRESLLIVTLIVIVVLAAHKPQVIPSTAEVTGGHDFSLDREWVGVRPGKEVGSSSGRTAKWPPG